MMKPDTQMPIEESVEGVYDRFEAAWVNDVIPQVEDFLPVGRPPEEHRDVLLKLVLIDLEKRWQRFHISTEATSEIASARATADLLEIPACPLLENYCLRYPVLGAVGKISSEAIAHEFLVRKGVGACPSVDEYSRRFPNRATELMTMFALLSVLKCGRNLVPSRATELMTIFAGSVSNQEINAEDTGASGPPGETITEHPLDANEFSSTQPFEDDIEISLLRYPVPELAKGRVFGRYRIESELGRGGMGAVYCAYDSHLHRTVALKVPFFKKGYSEEVVKRFLREARAVARLSHANLCRVFDVGVLDGTLFLTMEFVEGRSLEQLFKSGEPMPEADVVPVIRQVALALQEAHDCGIIHRDLKPANIMLNTKGQPVVMDFGLAREVDREENDLTKDGAFMGTPAYMSPEQIRGRTHEIGPATDIYSLGVVMYRLLTGRRPFEGTFTAIFSAILTENPIAPRDLCGTIDSTVEAICLKAMAKTPSDRYASAAEMATALNQVLQTSPAHSLGLRTIVGVVAVAAVMLVVALTNRGVSPLLTPNESRQQTLATVTVEKLDAVQSGGSANSFAGAKPVSPAADSNIAATEKPGIANPILETHLQRAQQQQGYEVLSQESLPLHAQDKLQFHVKLNAPSYVYLYLIDTNGMPNRLWPMTPEDLDEQKPVVELWAPPLAAEGQKQKMYFLDELHGQETVLVATSQRPLSQTELQAVESIRLSLAKAAGGKPKLVSFRKEDRERGFGGIVETDKELSVEIERFTERLSQVFDGYTGIVFPHE